MKEEIYASVINAVKEYNEAKISNVNLIRLYFFEVKTNLRLLEPIDTTTGTTDADKMIYNKIILCLEKNAASAILYGNDKKCAEKLKRESNVKILHDETDKIDETDNQLPLGNLLELVTDTACSISVMQKYITNDIQDNLNYKSRLSNLHSNMLTIFQRMRKLPEIVFIYK